MSNWIFYAVPEYKKIHYITLMFLIMVVIPKYFLGLQFTMLGNLINFLIYDFIYYQWDRVEQWMKRYNDEE